ncbi:TPA: SEC10/PgrA surface exclusion domain-containing protein [Streptococcus suis]|nr:SEC10/PgrA surface exclusion domain-containing protein [Streptococcus suis]HEM6106792.1 SEC10/PgrA surface exclusion domain-containing protein [Streptococcus suis]HEM6108946.1 SEC10/PgrA surface exclusion domain-containing protein [Streptococcus suis]HEM6115280.1 SEC10/PgrA surface exclusion domain-containing protein [Streptococcus suis]
MNKKTLKTLATGAAITLATVGASTVSADTQYGIQLNRVTGEWQTVNNATGEIVKSVPNETYSSYEEAEASLMASTVETPVATETPTAETNAVEAPKTAAEVQSEVDAQQAVVDATATEAGQAQAEVDTANQEVSNAQSAVDTAQAEKDQADSTVASKEADVKAAQDALSGTGLAEAQATLDQATADVKTAQDNVATATTAVDTAKKADADRQTKIDATTTDVAVKKDAVDTAKVKLTTAQDTVKTTTEAVSKATDAVKSATDALANVDTVTIADLTQFKADKASGDSDFMTDSGATAIEQSSTKIGEADKAKTVDVTNITDKQLTELSQYYAMLITELRQAMSLNSVVTTSEDAIAIAKEQVAKYIARGTNIIDNGHVSLAEKQVAENVGSIGTISTMYDLKSNAFDTFLATSFADAPSNWGHLTNNLVFGSKVGVAPVQINGQNYLVIAFTNSGTPITNPNDPATLQAALTQAQAALTAAQTASDEAKAKLTQASSDYATALELKTQAEKVLADVTATPLQTQVAENNLRLATIALQNAEARKADAQKAVDNFSADLATKKAALDTAKAELATAQATANSKAETLKTAQANLTSQQATLDSLNKEREALLAEKDRLVEEAKALAEELNGYLNAPAILAEAQATLTAKQAALTEAQAKAETAQTKLETVTAKLNEEKAKLAELQAEYETIKELEDKAKDNIIATLPDGTVVAVPKDAPTAMDKPAVDVNLVKDAVAKGQDVKVVDGKVVVTNPQAGVTVTQTATGEKVTYSRVERAKTLPNTGEQTSLLALAGVAVLSGLGLAAARRRRG